MQLVLPGGDRRLRRADEAVLCPGPGAGQALRLALSRAKYIAPRPM